MKHQRKRLPKGVRFVKQDGYRKNGGISKYCAFGPDGNAIGGGLLRAETLRSAKKELLEKLNFPLYSS